MTHFIYGGTFLFTVGHFQMSKRAQKANSKQRNKLRFKIIQISSLLNLCHKHRYRLFICFLLIDNCIVIPVIKSPQVRRVQVWAQLPLQRSCQSAFCWNSFERQARRSLGWPLTIFTRFPSFVFFRFLKKNYICSLKHSHLFVSNYFTLLFHHFLQKKFDWNIFQCCNALIGINLENWNV